MPSLVRLLTLACSALLFGPAVAQRNWRTPECVRNDPKPPAKLGQCIKTAIAAVQAVANADGDFTKACAEINWSQADALELDLDTLPYLICRRFNGNGVFYSDSDDVIAELSYVRVALRIVEDSSTDPVLTIICPELDLQSLYNIGLPASLIYSAACSGVYIEEPPQFTSGTPSSSSTSSASPSLPTSSDVTLTTFTDPLTYSGSSLFPPGYTDPSATVDPTSPPTTTLPPPYQDPTASSSSTSCTTTTSKAVTMHKRDDDLAERYRQRVKYVKSVIFAINLIKSNLDDDRCTDRDFWINYFNDLDYYGELVEVIICAAASGNDLFPPRTLDEAQASLTITFYGLIYAQTNKNDEARRFACDNLNYSVLSQAELNAAEIVQLVCYPPWASSSSSLTISPSTSSTALSSSESSDSSTPTSSSLSSDSSSSSSASSTVSSSSTEPSVSSTSTSSSIDTSSDSTSSSTISSSTSDSSSLSTSTASFVSVTSDSTTTSSPIVDPGTTSTTSSVSITSDSTISTPIVDPTASSSSSTSAQCFYFWDVDARGWKWSCASSSASRSATTTTSDPTPTSDTTTLFDTATLDTTLDTSYIPTYAASRYQKM